MRACLTLHRFLGPLLPVQSKPRRKLLFSALEAAIRGERLSLTALGRQLHGRAFVKHKIKKIYRLLADERFQADLPNFFRALAHGLLTPGTRPVLLIDWTHYGKCNDALVAAIAFKGRAIPIYVEVHGWNVSGNSDIEAAFLTTLKNDILPPDTRPVLVTDSGFRNPWFRHAMSLGWDVVGRLQGGVLVQPTTATAEVWTALSVLHGRADATPRSLGQHQVAKTNAVELQLVVYKSEYQRPQAQKRSPSAKGGQGAALYRRRAAEPWMLVCSLSEASAAQIVGWYAARMQIEEMFRDDKNAQTGIGLDTSRGRNAGPLLGLRVISALASLVTLVVGQVGETLGLERHYQVNTERKRRVLSLTFLGRQMLRHEDYRRFSPKRLQQALQQIRHAALASSICWSPDL